MSYQKWREEFIAEFSRAFPNAAYRYPLGFLREATAEQRWNEISCSIDVGEAETARQERRETARHKRVEAMAREIGATIEWQGDPRGCPFAVKLGDRLIYVPGRGLPARCFQ